MLIKFQLKAWDSVIENIYLYFEREPFQLV